MALDELEAAFDAASAKLTASRAACKRSKSQKNVAAFIAASADFDAALEAFTTARDAAEAADARAELRARRLAIVAPRRALKAAQMDLFA